MVHNDSSFGVGVSKTIFENHIKAHNRANLRSEAYNVVFHFWDLGKTLKYFQLRRLVWG